MIPFFRFRMPPCTPKSSCRLWCFKPVQGQLGNIATGFIGTPDIYFATPSVVRWPPGSLLERAAPTSLQNRYQDLRLHPSTKKYLPSHSCYHPRNVLPTTFTPHNTTKAYTEWRMLLRTVISGSLRTDPDTSNRNSCTTPLFYFQFMPSFWRLYFPREKFLHTYRIWCRLRRTRPERLAQ